MFYALYWFRYVLLRLKPRLAVPSSAPGLLMTAATILGPIGGKKVGIHPARVKKLMVSTNISGQKLAESGYAFHAGLEDTFRDWFEDCGKQGLY